MIDGYWLSVRDGDERALALFRRHYSCKRHYPHVFDRGNRARIAGNGAHSVLLTLDADALLVWRRVVGQGVLCSVFRNESPVLSSTLILEAEMLAWARWPGERLFTFIEPAKVRSSNPGCCFRKAGWRRYGATQKGLLVLEKRAFLQHAEPLTPYLELEKRDGKPRHSDARGR